MSIAAYLAVVPVFLVLLLVHEAGHYVAARATGIAVAEFSVGLGPRLGGFRAGGTEWSLRAVPLMGYVRWHEEGPEAFDNAPAGARVITLLAGPLANLVLVFILAIAAVRLTGATWLETPGLAVQYTAEMIRYFFGAVIDMFRGIGLDQLSGAVGIARQTAQAASEGSVQLSVAAALLSLNLAVLNLLPLPFLDGGRICLVGLERLRRRRLDPLLEGWIHVGGFVALVLLGLVMVLKDLLA